MAGSDGLRRRAVVPVEDIQPGDEIHYTWSGERWRVAGVTTDHESGYVYVALVDRRTGAFEQIDRFKPDSEATVYTSREVSV